jgi:FdhD protein
MGGPTDIPSPEGGPCVLRPAGGRSVALAAEVPVALVFNGISYAVMLASPADLADFARGFALSEGIVERAEEVRDVVVRTVADGIEVAAELAPRRFEALKARRRSLAGRTGCGICGVEALGDAVRPPAPVAEGSPITDEAIARALAALPGRQALNAAVHALHAAAWAAPDGTILTVREDVGRHNALDKLIGARTASGEGFADGFLVITSRCSVEMVQKAARAGIAIVVAVSAPTALAVDLAERVNVTLVAAAGRGVRAAFSHPRRLA